MEDIDNLLAQTQAQVEYFKQLHEANPSRKLNAVIKKLEVREKTLEELV